MITNGVSFSLVAGACCIVRTSVKFFYKEGATANITLNINSTGAKGITRPGSMYISSRNPVRVAEVAIKQYMEIDPIIFVTYDGSNYIVTQNATLSYNDYLDGD